MRILVTGATGRVGSNLVKALVERGDSVRSLVMPDDPKRSKLDGIDTEIVEGDLTDPESLDKAVAGVEAIIHTACVMGRPETMSREKYFDINVKGMLFLLEAVRNHIDAIQKFVYMSSDAIYPAAYAPLYTPVDERHPKLPNEEYGMIKRLDEEMLWTYRRELDLPASIVRPGAIAACDEILRGWNGALAVSLMKRAEQAKRGPLYIPGQKPYETIEKQAQPLNSYAIIRDTEGKPWKWHKTDVRDVVHGTICALDSDSAIGEDFNILGPCAIPFDEAVKYLAEKQGVSYIECEAPVQWVYECDITKARNMIGYRPQYDLYRMVDDALAFQRGEDIGVIPA